MKSMPTAALMLVPAVSALLLPAPSPSSDIASLMRGVVHVEKAAWPKAPSHSTQNAFFQAKIAGRAQPIGTCGIEVLDISADGLTSADGVNDDDLKPRAVLSGTLFVTPEYRRQGLARA